MSREPAIRSSPLWRSCSRRASGWRTPCASPTARAASSSASSAPRRRVTRNFSGKADVLRRHRRRRLHRLEDRRGAQPARHRGHHRRGQPAAGGQGEQPRRLRHCRLRRPGGVHRQARPVRGRGGRPLNVYGYSKFLFDQAVRERLAARTAQIAGLRYFNVYGPNEAHKGRMASVAFHAYRQLLELGRVKLFVGSGGYGNGEQRRDFIHVDDVVEVNLWFLEQRELSGIFNCGTGRAQTFNQLAAAVINSVQGAQLPVPELVGKGLIEYVPFPAGLADRYQSFTEADLSRLRAAGYSAQFMSVEQGVAAYVKALQRK